jgi:hypothetical protein
MTVDRDEIHTCKIKDFYHPCTEFSRAFDFAEYWDSFVVPLDERFKKWDELEYAECEELGASAKKLPEIRKGCCGDKYYMPQLESVKVVWLLTTEWVVVETYKMIPECRIRPEETYKWLYDVVQFHRVLNKLYKNKELTAEEAIEELKKWKFEMVDRGYCYSRA